LNKLADIPVVILCGGRGTRIAADVPEVPKTLVDIGGRPLLEHVIGIYAAAGCRRFLLATGFRADMIAAHFTDAVTRRCGADEIRCIDTGLDSPTGERLRRLQPQIGTRCFATYGDGVADIDLAALLDHHVACGSLATLTVVQPESNFGVVDLDGARVTGFREKPRMNEWVNGGFFVLEPAALASLRPGETLERGPMERWAAAGQLAAYRHAGFWRCMDTFKDALALNELCRENPPPWPRPHA
jgi:glucose-1-phosphate cytidylyltransferase